MSGTKGRISASPPGRPRCSATPLTHRPPPWDREADAEDRDIADLVALRDLRRIVAGAIARAGRIDRIQHPDRRDDPPPDSRYSAIDDDTYWGPGCPIGTGPTEAAAITDLLEQLDMHTEQ